MTEATFGDQEGAEIMTVHNSISGWLANVPLLDLCVVAGLFPS